MAAVRYESVNAGEGYCPHDRLRSRCGKCSPTGTSTSPPPPSAAPARPRAPAAPRDPTLPRLFPYATARAPQRAFLREARAALDEGHALIVHAPTGTGKTVSSLVSVLDHPRLREKTVVFVTNRRSQRAIVAKELGQIATHAEQRLTLADLPSKQSMCTHPVISREPEHKRFLAQCAAAVQGGSCDAFNRFRAGARPTLGAIATAATARERSATVGVCPFEVSVERAAQARVVVLDYNHVFTDNWSTTLERIGRPPADLALVVDEAHNLVDRARDGSQRHVTLGVLDEAEREAKHAGEPAVARYARRLYDAVAALTRPHESARRFDPMVVPGGALRDGVSEQERGELTEQMRTAAGRIRAREGSGVALEAVADFVDQWFTPAPLTRILARDDERWTLSVSLIDPRPIVRQRAESVAATILMSGTLFPAELHRDAMGLEPSRTRVAELASDFPPENRPVLYHQGLTTSFTARGEATYRAYADRIVSARAAVGSNVAAFFPSYAFLRNVAQCIDPHRGPIIAEESGMTDAAKQDLLERLRSWKGRGGAILMGVYGGSLAEGVDYPDNLLRAVLLCGIPLPPREARLRTILDHHGRTEGAARAEERQYVAPAMVRVVQAAGRGVRGPNDKCEVHFLDDRFFAAQHQRLLPPDLRWAVGPAG